MDLTSFKKVLKKENLEPDFFGQSGNAFNIGKFYKKKGGEKK